MLGRATQGVKIMKFDEGTRIVAMAKAIKEEDDGEKPAASAKNGGEQMTL